MSIFAFSADFYRFPRLFSNQTGDTYFGRKAGACKSLDTSAGAKRVQSAQLLSRPVLVARHSTSKSARRLASARPAARGASALLSFVGSTLCTSRPRSAEARPSSVGLVRSYASRGTRTHKGHGDCTPFMGACGCTPIPEVYPPPPGCTPSLGAGAP